MLTPPEIILRRLIGIGRDLTASPLPQPPDNGSRLRRFNSGESGGPYTPTGVSSPGVPAVGASQVPAMIRGAPRQRPSHRAASGPDSSPPFRPAARLTAGLRCCQLTSAGWSKRMAPPSVPRHETPPVCCGQRADRSLHSRRIDQVQPRCGWRTSLMACPLVPTVPDRLPSGSCPTPRPVVPRRP